ncbi:winged helix-turn-helix transcriptional regulator [Aggregicoccus sp. 17bor-14]|uniref:MarR family winged helix-turn-helix transcriptional regulator n=1 Tax=Myxococcaceae TaxID=31 RepID=UPI00129CBA10|nr:MULTISPECIES: MarR family winged helix-turn-helix transcriptional regulator [Myxococcaceae]MBF5044612.1 winged helix-turn-helix transcriptional regulator [Simulacricoccus sp. 17bor-14]MRI90356.1 winged helix-turn-helix transcriptional regulator [Aggregicoccus sp. 17bor-14]
MSTRSGDEASATVCNCLALRQAARRVTQHYDSVLAPTGLRTTQYSLLTRLVRRGPMTIQELSADLVMDRTTLGRNVLPLERDGLLTIRPGATDRRRRELHVTREGAARQARAARYWEQAQAQFEQHFGVRRARELRAVLHDVSTGPLGAEPLAEG